MRILLVDDDEDARQVLGLVLRSAGHEVEEAVDGLDAVEKLRAGSCPSLVLLDMMMPRLDGEGFLRAMREDACMARTQVWLLSGHREARKQAQELGAAGCLVKPVELEQLFAALRNAAGGKEVRH